MISVCAMLDQNLKKDDDTSQKESTKSETKEKFTKKYVSGWFFLALAVNELYYL